VPKGAVFLCVSKMPGLSAASEKLIRGRFKRSTQRTLFVLSQRGMAGGSH
jgi:TctA family transporter